MNPFRPLRLLLTLTALTIGSAQAANDPVVILQGSAAPGDSTFSLRHEQPASCSVQGQGDCASCSVSCQTGQAAVCKPGKVSAAMGDGSCQREPVCRCESATPGPSTKR